MKDKILGKATDMFIELGFKSVTMDDIANELGISKKTIYTHFSNKTKLVEASTFHLFDKICGGIDQICIRKHNSIEELFEIKSFVLKNLQDEKSSPQHQLQKYYPEIFSDMKKRHLEVMQDCVTDNLKRGVENGLYRSELDLDFTTRIYFTGMLGIKDHDAFPSEKYNKADLMQSYLEYHVRAIATAKGLETLNKFTNNPKN